MMKYCPLCSAEYRRDVGRCATCGARIVDSLEADAAANPPRLLWAGKDLHEFELVAAALRDAEIPARLQEQAPGIFGTLMGSASTIHVLGNDLARALELAAAAASSREPRSEAQVCHACGAECAEALAVCPQCKTILLVERETASEPGKRSEPRTSAMKYCPLCDAEYPASSDCCTVCGVDLVPEKLRGRPLDERQRNERIDVVWRGGDPVAVSEVITTLRDAAIHHHVQATSDHLVFELGMPRPKYAVRVFASDVARAGELLGDIRETPAFSLSETPVQEERGLPAAQRSARVWKPGAATVEIWKGADSALAEVLEACLRENSIGVRRAGREPGLLRLLIMPEDESSAREIVREVREGTPPA